MWSAFVRRMVALSAEELEDMDFGHDNPPDMKMAVLDEENLCDDLCTPTALDHDNLDEILKCFCGMAYFNLTPEGKLRLRLAVFGGPKYRPVAGEPAPQRLPTFVPAVHIPVIFELINDTWEHLPGHFEHVHDFVFSFYGLEINEVNNPANTTFRYRAYERLDSMIRRYWRA